MVASRVCRAVQIGLALESPLAPNVCRSGCGACKWRERHIG